LMVRVRPGVELTCASLCPSRELIRLDLPTFDLPRNANSGGPSAGNPDGADAAVTNFAIIGFIAALHLYQTAAKLGKSALRSGG
jgi:hypothetical protein